MDFLGNAMKMFGGSNAAGSIAGALQQNMGNLDQNSVQGIGQQLLKSFNDTQAYPGSGDEAAAAAGVDSQAVQSGEPSAVHGLLELAKQHPEVVQNAVQGVMQNHPGLAQQLMPMLSGLLSKG